MKTLRVLLICDEDDEVISWNAVLNPLELETDLASTYQIVSSSEVAEGYDLAIIDTSDWQSNIDLCRILRPVHSGVLLLCTNCPDESQMIEGLEAGGDDFMVKSAGYQLLQAKIQMWCRRLEKYRDMRGGLSEDGASTSDNPD